MKGILHEHRAAITRRPAPSTQPIVTRQHHIGPQRLHSRNMHRIGRAKPSRDQYFRLAKHFRRHLMDRFRKELHDAIAPDGIGERGDLNDIYPARKNPPDACPTIPHMTKTAADSGSMRG